MRLLELPYSGGTAAAARFLASLQTLTDGAAPDADGLYVEMRDSTLTGRSLTPLDERELSLRRAHLLEHGPAGATLDPTLPDIGLLSADRAGVVLAE